MNEPYASIGEALQQATAHHRAGRLQQAAQIYRDILTREPENADALHFLGLIAYQTGRNESAAELIQKALAANPDNAKYHNNLGLVLRSQGKLEAAADSFRRTIELDAGVGGARANLGAVLAQLDRSDEAIAIFRKAIELDPRSEGAYNNLGNLLHQQGKLDEAGECYRRAVALSPGNTDALINLGLVQLKTRRPAQALETFETCLGANRFNRRALAWKAVALSELGKDADAAEIMDLDTDIAAMRLDESSPDIDLATLNTALASELVVHPTLEWEPGAKTTYGGAQTGNLLDGPSDAVAAFEWHLRASIDDFLASFEGMETRPYMREIPRRYLLRMWAVLLSEEGHQLTHIHPSGWLSGAYYVRIPDAINRAEDHAGWIEFGRPGYEVPYSYEPRVRLIKPEEGMLALFPSYVFHRTIPFESPDKRITIAFDLYPAR